MIVLPPYIPSRDMPLAEAADRAQEALRASGHEAAQWTGRVQDQDLRAFARVLDVVVDQGGAHELVVVATEPWTRALEAAFLREFTPLRLDSARYRHFHFVSAYPLGPMLDFVFAPRLSGRFEAEASASLADGPRGSEIGDLVRLGLRLIKSNFGLELDLDDIGAIDTIGDLLLSQIRPCADPSLALEPGVYLPSATLLILGAMLGEIVRRAHPDQVEWVGPPEAVGGQHPVLELRRADGEGNRWYVFPFDKVLQIYQNGRDRDLGTYYDVVIRGTLCGEGIGEAGLERFDAAAERLLPVLKPSKWARTHQVEGIELLEDGPIGTPVVAVAIDHPRQIAFVTRDKLDEWGVDFPELMGRACANLARVTRDVAEHFEDLGMEELQVYRLDYADYFNASRIMLAELLYRGLERLCPATETFMVAVPNRDHLLASSATDDQGRAAFQSVVSWFHERQPAPISSVCFILGSEGVIGYYGIVPDA